MAQKIVFLFLFGLFLYHPAHSQHWSSISGEGKVVTQEINVDHIHGVNLSLNGKVILTQGSMQKIVIEGQQNIIDNIKKEVHGGSWTIEFDKNVKNAEPVTITITLPKLDEIGLSGSGTITSTNQFSHLDDLDINISGSGHLDINFEAKETELNLSGSGKANLVGNSNEIKIHISGSGKITAKDLVTKDCQISISGSGDAAVNVNGDLTAAISGSGDVTYKGSANVHATVSGSGSVTKM